MLTYSKTTIVNDPKNILAYVKGAAGSATTSSATGLAALYVGGNSGVTNTINTLDSSTNKYKVNAKSLPTTKLVVKWADELWQDDTHTIKFLGKTSGVDALNAIAAVDLTGLTANNIYRLTFYIRLRNNNSSLYSNNWTFKGKPFVVEFKTTGTSVDGATLVKQIDKQLTFEYGSKLIKASATAPSNYASYTDATGAAITNDKTIYFLATDQWQMFMDQDGENGVKLEKLVTGSTGSGYRAVTGVDGDYWEAVANKVAINNGHEAFGDFAHLVKDQRLPTNANLRWEGIATGDVFGGNENDDKPKVGTLYTQYSLQYDAERGVGQQSVLGGVGTSRTTHVFYVASGAVAAFDQALIKIGVISDNASGGTANVIDATDTAGSNALASNKVGGVVNTK